MNVVQAIAEHSRAVRRSPEQFTPQEVMADAVFRSTMAVLVCEFVSVAGRLPVGASR